MIMLGKGSRPMIGKMSELLVSGNHTAFFDVATSPKSPLELKIHSPRGVKNYDLSGGVGLGIVAALDKSGDAGGREILPRYAMSSPRPVRTDPIPVNYVKNCNRIRECYEEPEMDSFEDCSYSSMTCHGPKNDSFTLTRGENRRNGFDKKIKNASIFSVSPAICPEDATVAFPSSDFLSSCHLCRKKLHGKDIYMYRGEKAFCSTECRERQIMIDDRKEKCRSEATRSVDVSSSPCEQRNIFSNGILAI